MSEDKKPKKTIAVTHDEPEKQAVTSPKIELAQRSVLKAPIEDAPTQPGAPEIKRAPAAKTEKTEPDTELSAGLMEIANRAKRVKAEAEAGKDAKIEAETPKETPAAEDPKEPTTALDPPNEKAEGKAELIKTPTAHKVEPSAESPKPEAEEPKTEKSPEEPKVEVEDVSISDSMGDDAKADAEAVEAKQAQAPVDDAAAKQAAERDAALQKLADSKQYYLPIKTVEQRRSQKVVVLGTLLSIVLVLAWVNIALDAGLISLGNIEPLTHFFSN